MISPPFIYCSVTINSSPPSSRRYSFININFCRNNQTWFLLCIRTFCNNFVSRLTSVCTLFPIKCFVSIFMLGVLFRSSDECYCCFVSKILVFLMFCSPYSTITHSLWQMWLIWFFNKETTQGTHLNFRTCNMVNIPVLIQAELCFLYKGLNIILNWG